jgi:hypothetical protein
MGNCAEVVLSRLSMALRRAIIVAGATLILLGVGWLIATAPARVLEERQRAWGVRIQEGDVVFQDIDCGVRCALIREVTQSRYAHVGIVLNDRGALRVWEAYEPVGSIDLVDWIHRGIGERVAIYRFRSRFPLAAMASAIRSFAGRPYDGDYQWDDERIYCSELIAKAANQVQGSPIFVPKPIGDLGPHAELIKRMSHGRLTEKTVLVSPLDLTRSSSLEMLVDELAR